MAKLQERLNRQGQAYISNLAATARQLWLKACDFDAIPPTTSFVVFSDGNKFAQFYNTCMARMFEARQEYAAGGYVGLTIGKR